MKKFFLFCLCTGLAFAKTSLESSAQMIRSAPVFSLNYTVVQHMDLNGQSKTQKGSLVFDHQGHFQLKSSNIIISLDDQEYREYRISSKQILLKKATAANVMSPAQILYKYLECPVIGESKSGNLIELKLNPKGKFREAKTLKVWLNAQSFAPVKVQYQDASNNSYTYTLSSLKPQGARKAEQFRIQAPSGVETVDLR